jgi:hypothetical protein
MSIFIAVKLIIGLIIRYVSLIIIGKIFLNPVSSLGLEPRAVFWFINVAPVISPPKLWSCAVILSCSVSKLQKPPSPGLEFRTLSEL